MVLTVLLLKDAVFFCNFFLFQVNESSIIHISISFCCQTDLFFQLDTSLDTQLYLCLKNRIISGGEASCIWLLIYIMMSSDKNIKYICGFKWSLVLSKSPIVVGFLFSSFVMVLLSRSKNTMKQ